VQLAAISASESLCAASSLHGLGLATDANALHGRLRSGERRCSPRQMRLATPARDRMRASGANYPARQLARQSRRCASLGGASASVDDVAYVTANGNCPYHAYLTMVAKDYSGLILGNASTEPSRGSDWRPLSAHFRTDFESDTPPDPCRRAAGGSGI